MKKNITLIFTILLITLQSSCVQNRTGQTTAAGAGIGAVTGALFGQAIGKDTKSTITGAAVGAGVGALAGYAYGQYLDQQEKELRQRFAASRNVIVNRPSENELKVGYDSASMFQPNSDTLKPSARQEINSTAQVLKKYPNSVVVVQNEDTSPNTSDQQLSQRRVESVRKELRANGVANERLLNKPASKTQPVATIDSGVGQQHVNRGIELLIREPSSQG